MTASLRQLIRYTHFRKQRDTGLHCYTAPPSWQALLDRGLRLGSGPQKGTLPNALPPRKGEGPLGRQHKRGCTPTYTNPCEGHGLD